MTRDRITQRNIEREPFRAADNVVYEEAIGRLDTTQAYLEEAYGIKFARGDDDNDPGPTHVAYVRVDDVDYALEAHDAKPDAGVIVYGRRVTTELAEAEAGQALAAFDCKWDAF